ncbi:MAG: hypothetical protein HYU51_06935 [Candidatus Rokubacteria bacterium]|nr:hypothetical protein [Candidatus Rokubacteria bacterium]
MTKRWTAAVAGVALAVAVGGCAGTMSGEAMMQKEMKSDAGTMKGEKGMMPGDKTTMEKDKAMMDKGGMDKK